MGAELATRALAARDPGLHAGGREWISSTGRFSQASFALLWSERYGQLRPVIDASIVRARAAGDSIRLAMCLANRGWLAYQCGDLRAAEADARTALAATELPAPPMFRVLNGAVLLKALVAQGELNAAEKALAPLDFEVESGSLISPPLRLARGLLRVAQGRIADGLEDMVAVGALLTRALVTSPVLSWRSDAALALLALGDRAAAERLAEEELRLARAFGAPRTLGVALRAAGVVAGGDRGASLLRDAIDACERGDATRGTGARPCRPRSDASTAQSPHRSARPVAGGARRRPPSGRETFDRVRGDGAPRLSDKETRQIVSNESGEIMRMLETEFGVLTTREVDLYPVPLRDQIDALNESIYESVNNGVYTAGFTTRQDVYEQAFEKLFDALDQLEERLVLSRFLDGRRITEADLRLFVSLVRFDAVYYTLFKCNRRRIVDYPNLWGYTRDVYQQPLIAATVSMDQIKSHYTERTRP